MENSIYNEALNLFNSNQLNEARSLLEEGFNGEENLSANYLLGLIESTSRNYSRAVKLYDKVLKEDPNHFESKYNKALSLHKNGELDLALEAYQEVIKQKPDFEDALNNIAYIHKVQNNLVEAGKYILKIVGNNKNSLNLESEIREIEPTLKDEDFQKAIKLNESGKNIEALEILDSLLNKYPNRFEILHSIATIYFFNSQYNEAITYFEKILSCKGHEDVAYYGVGLCNQRMNNYDKAVKYYDKTLEINPEYQDAMNNAGLIYFENKKFDKADQYYQRSMKTNNKHFHTLINLGALRTQEDNYSEAMQLFDVAMDYAKAANNKVAVAIIYGNIGYCHLRARDLNECIANCNIAISYDDENVLAHYNKGEALLTLGEFEEGWKEYTWRIKRKDFGNRKFFKPLKKDTDIKNKRIYVYGEQGLGDSIQFFRYLKLLKDKGAYVIFECSPKLFNIFRSTNCIDEFIEKQNTPQPLVEYDYDMPLLDLPLLFMDEAINTKLSSPYIFPNKERVDYWADYIQSDKFKIGIVWQGNKQHPNDNNRSIKLSQLEFLFDIDSIQVYSIQMGDSENQIDKYKSKVIDLNDFQRKGFEDDIAIMQHLDLIITVDTSIAHLAGALGKETWVPLAFNADWRWLENRTDSPWYPSLKLYRQKKIKEWKPVFEQMKKDLVIKVHNSNKETNCNTKLEKYAKLESFLEKISSDIYPEIVSDMHNDITKSVIKNLANSKVLSHGTKVLDVGCGQAVALKLFKELKCDAIGITLGQEDYNYCIEHGYNAKIMDMSFLDFDDASFDFLWVRHALEHSIFPYYTLSEFERVLKPDGIIYIEVPAPDTDAKHQSNPNHYSVLTKSSWESLIARFGFEQLEFTKIPISMANDETDEFYSFFYRKKKFSK